ERILVGHPFNPPHIIPLVEVVGGTKTSPDAIQQALAFYASIGKKPIQLKKELPGHVGNRLQAALYKEIMYLIQHDVLSVEDADVAVSRKLLLQLDRFLPNRRVKRERLLNRV